MHWVVQNNICNEAGHDTLLQALERRGLPHNVCKVIPFVGVLEPDVHPENPVIVMGSTTLMRIAEERGWWPGGLLSHNFDFEVQRAHWGNLMLNAGGLVCALVDVPEQSRPFFIRPTLDTKSFPGYVTDWPSFVEWRDRVLALTPEDGATVMGATRVLVAPAQTIYREARFWIVDGKVVTGSIYKLGTRVVSREILVGDPLREVAVDISLRGTMTRGRVCDTCGEPCKFQPARVYCLDVAETPDGPRILEVNCLVSAGYYAADLDALVEALESFGRRRR